MAVVDFAVRADSPELMDADDLPAATYAALIADLARVNTVTLARPPTLHWLARASRGMDRFSLVDVGFGHGDMLRAIAHWAQRAGKTAELTGIDLNPRSAPVAQAASAGLDIRYLTGDAAVLVAEGGAIGRRPDFIVCSLVAHHMTDPELIGFIRWMDAAAVRGWFINDLHRHRVAWLGFRALAGVLRWHTIVRHDGALSVRRAFVRADWTRLLAAAGVDGAQVRWHLPFRWGVGREK